MKNSPNEDEQLSALLRGQMPTLADQGFSRRVVARLPAPRRSFRGFIWPLAGAAAGIGFAVWRSGTLWPELGENAPQWTAGFASVLSALANPWLLLALAMTGASLLIGYAFTRTNTRFL